MKKLAIKLIKWYQKQISPTKGHKCRHKPTCSNYALEAYETHNFFYATFLSTRRILTCNPLFKPKYDPVPLKRISKRKAMKTGVKTLAFNNSFTIIQFADLHLMRTDKDQVILDYIENKTTEIKPDLVVFTGDQTMGKDSLELYRELGYFMEGLGVNWSFIFGNNDNEFVKYKNLIKAVYNNKLLLFNEGKTKGHSNYFIKLASNEKLVSLLFFLDSGVWETYKKDNKKIDGYGEVSNKQLAWVKETTRNYKKDNPNLTTYIFQHIPPYEVSLVDNDNTSSYSGNYNEKPGTPPVKNNLLEIQDDINLKGVFYGHNHYNDFTFKIKEAILAYGRVTGYYDYLDIKLNKGARVIKIDSNGELETYIIE